MTEKLGWSVRFFHTRHLFQEVGGESSESLRYYYLNWLCHQHAARDYS